MSETYDRPPEGYSWHVEEWGEFIHKPCGEIVPDDQVHEHVFTCPT